MTKQNTENEARYATVEVFKNNQWHTVWVSKAEWASISHVDYIELDENGNLTDEYQTAYSPTVQANMLTITEEVR